MWHGIQQIFPGKETSPAHEVNSIDASEQKDLQHASGWKRHVSPCTALSFPPPAAGRGTAGDPSARWLSSAPLDPSSLSVDEPEQRRKSVSSVRLPSGAPPASGAFWPNSKQARLLPLIRFHYNNSPGSNTQRERDCCKVYASMYWVSDKKPRGKIINRTALNSHMREERLSVKVIMLFIMNHNMYMIAKRHSRISYHTGISATHYTWQLSGEVWSRCNSMSTSIKQTEEESKRGDVHCSKARLKVFALNIDIDIVNKW